MFKKKSIRQQQKTNAINIQLETKYFQLSLLPLSHKKKSEKLSSIYTQIVVAELVFKYTTIKINEKTTRKIQSERERERVEEDKRVEIFLAMIHTRTIFYY